MPYCPKCRVEYEEGFTRCSDCDIELVAELPQEFTDVPKKNRKPAYIVLFVVLYILTVFTFILLLRNSNDELAKMNNNYDIMAKRAADSIAENDKLKTENNDLQKRLQDLNNASNTTGSKSSNEQSGKQDIVTIQKFEYKNFNYSGYTGRGAQLKVLINNTTMGNFSVNPSYFRAITDKNRTISKSTDLLVNYEYKANEKIGFDLVDLIPGTQTDGTIFFELRDDEKIVKVIYDCVGDGQIEIPIEK